MPTVKFRGETHYLFSWMRLLPMRRHSMQKHLLVAGMDVREGVRAANWSRQQSGRDHMRCSRSRFVRVSAGELCYLYLPGQANLLEQPDAVVIGIEFIPCESVTG